MQKRKVADIAELRDGARVAVAVGGNEVVVFLHEEEVIAYLNVCPHQGGPVAEGMLIGRVEAATDAHGNPCEAFSKTETHIVCPWHGFEFNVRTGVCATNDRISLRRYETLVEGDAVFLLLPGETVAVGAEGEAVA
jgi:nitrite reductase (NADH) small subunit